jgi:glycosyltransferase involved in cell wall biosynthesis
MRILHVATLVSAAGTYGGPVSAALAQCDALARRGHSVTLVAGWDGTEQPTSGVFDIRLHRVHRIPGTGLAGLFSLSLLEDLWRQIARADVVHIHMARDLVTLPAAAVAILLSKPLVVQGHGMIRVDERAKSRIVDALVTRRVLARAAAQLVITDEEGRDADVVARRQMPVVRVVNGVSTSSRRARWHADEAPDIVFCSRLHPGKRPMVFVDLARQMLEQGVDATFSIIGPDGGLLTDVLTAIAAIGDRRLRYEGSLMHSEVPDRLSRSQALILPSLREHLPMVMLESLSVGLPIVVPRDIGLPEQLTRLPAVISVGEHPDDLASAVRALLSSSEEWKTRAESALNAVDHEFSVAAVAERVERLYVAICLRA